MPLITCPDCGREISDAAPACPHCGRPAAAPLARAQLAQGRAARRQRFGESGAMGRATVVRVVIGGAGVLMLLAQFALTEPGSHARAILSDLITVAVGLVLLLVPEGRDNPRPPAGSRATWGTWFADRDRERTMQWNTVAGGVLVLAGVAGLLVKWLV